MRTAESPGWVWKGCLDRFTLVIGHASIDHLQPTVCDKSFAGQQIEQPFLCGAVFGKEDDPFFIPFTTGPQGLLQPVDEGLSLAVGAPAGFGGIFPELIYQRFFFFEAQLGILLQSLMGLPFFIGVWDFKVLDDTLGKSPAAIPAKFKFRLHASNHDGIQLVAVRGQDAREPLIVEQFQKGGEALPITIVIANDDELADFWNCTQESPHKMPLSL